MKLLTELFPYQRDAADKLSHVKVGALYMEMGTGKTRTALEIIQRRHEAGKVTQVLWLCPYSVVNDLPELLAEHVEDFLPICRICGIESLSNSNRIYNELLLYVSLAPTHLVVDESLLVKNPQAYRTRHVMAVSGGCGYKLILNGTPMSKNIGDLYAQWYVLDWRILGYKSYWSFQANHLEMDPERPGRVIRAHNKEYLAAKIAPYTYEVSKKDVLDIPPKRYERKHFYMTDEQESHYDDISKKLLELVDEHRPETIYRLFGAMQAITSGFAVRLDGYHTSRYRMYQPEDNPRIQELFALLQRIGGSQVVIFCKYTQEIDDILSVLGGTALPFFGEMTQPQRQSNKNAFRAGDAQYLVANKSCAQFGLNLQFCHNEIFYNNDWDWATREQAEDRLHRVGQARIVSIYDILAWSTIDKTIMDCIIKKETLADAFKREIKKNNKTDALKLMLRGKGQPGGEDLPEQERL